MAPSGKSGQKSDQQAQDPRDAVHGEGNYEASRRFDREEKAFVDAGKVDEAARKAPPESAEVARDLEQAEQAGRARSRGEDGGAPAKPQK